MSDIRILKIKDSLVLGPAELLTIEHIDSQRKLIAVLAPGSPDHRMATKVLLLLQDSLHATAAARAALSKL